KLTSSLRRAPCFSMTEHAPAEPHPLSLHDALPISPHLREIAPCITGAAIGLHSLFSTSVRRREIDDAPATAAPSAKPSPPPTPRDRKSTRLNSSHVKISYAVFCLKKNIRSQTEPPT